MFSQDGARCGGQGERRLLAVVTAAATDTAVIAGGLIAAAATIARFDPEWAAQENWGGMVDLLVKDAANWDRSDERFPFLRNFEPYVGHAYASGHAGFAAGNNQESSSESTHFAQAVAL